MRFRFTIRDLLWLTVVVALAVGWWLDHSRSKARIFDLEHPGINFPYGPGDPGSRIRSGALS